MFGLGQEMTLHGVHHCRKTDDQSHAKNQSTLRQNRQNDDVYKEQSIQKHDLIITLFKKFTTAFIISEILYNLL